MQMEKEMEKGRNINKGIKKFKGEYLDVYRNWKRERI